ncbi:hypothetical protein AAE478_006219 [Parahypoxylon ruwenzoriense]
MKLIISGATGFVGRELIRQSLSRPEITSVVALARKPITPDRFDDGADLSKLKSVVVEDYNRYPEDVLKEFAGAAACIWTVAITPTKSRTYDFEEVKRICQTCTLVGMKAIYGSGVSKPFRFLYMSGAAAGRDPTKPPRFQPQYSLMRGETENQVLALAKELDEVEACVAKPGLIVAQGEILKSIAATMMGWVADIPGINLVDLSTAMLDQVINGFDKEPLMPEDLIRIAKTAHKST